MDRPVCGADGSTLWTACEGAGPVLVLSNGGPGCCDYLKPVSDLVSDIATVVRWEQRGCGRSCSEGPYDLEQVIADLEVIRQAYGFDRWSVGGHSWGANVALAYALEHPSRVRSIVYIAGNGAQNDREWHAAYDQGRVETPELLPEFLFPYNPEVNRFGNGSWRRYIKQPNFLRRVADLDMDALFVVGTQDIRPLWPVEQLANLIPRAELHVIEGAGHHIELTHAEELQEILRRFLGI